MRELQFDKSFFSFEYRLVHSCRKLIVFLILVLIASWSFESWLYSLLIIIVIKTPLMIKRSAFYVIYFVEYKDDFRVVGFRYNKLFSHLISKDLIKTEIDVFRSRDIGYYLRFYRGNYKLIEITDSYGWTVVDFLDIMKATKSKIPNLMQFRKKFIINYMLKYHSDVKFDNSKLN